MRINIISLLGLLLIFTVSCTKARKETEMSLILKEAASSYHFVPENKYFSSNIIPYYDSLLEISSGYSKNSLQFKKATALLYGGKTDEAIAILKELYDMKKKAYSVVGLDNHEEASIEKMLALSYLRLGEQENCILNH